MAERTEVLTEIRIQLLERCEAADWPEICGAGVGRVEGAAAWTVAVEAATGDELILLARLLFERAA
jgi:hypothetical protein